MVLESSVVSRLRRRSLSVDPALYAGVHPILARVYAARGVGLAELEASPQLSHLLDYRLLSGMDEALELLMWALEQHKRILVVGDYDADGATSTALLVTFFRKLGKVSIDYLVPDRFKTGYGLTPALVACALERQPDLLITVDHGTTGVEGVAMLRAEGVRVLVTDHHLPGDRLPEADAIINPNLSGDPFPSKNLAGVGVAFYLALALRARLRDLGWFDQNDWTEPHLGALLDLVALGTVADVVPLDANNRLLVRHGLARIQKGLACAGIRALLACASRAEHSVGASDLGFVLAPRLNAAGRLEHMAVGVECLLATTLEEAMPLAQRLHELNEDRKVIQLEMQQTATETLRELCLDRRHLPSGICLYHPDWHQGIIGILAGRLKDQYHRPAIIFALSEEGDLKGSARSTPDLNIRDVLAYIAEHHPDILQHFGGHAMAAGLTLKRMHFDRFQKIFCEAIERFQAEPYTEVLWTDGPLGASDLTLEFARLLRQAGPFGHSFPEPRFEGVFRLLGIDRLKGAHLRFTLQTLESGRRLEGIAFSAPEAWYQPRADRVALAYRLEINEYRAEPRLQLGVDDFEVIRERF